MITTLLVLQTTKMWRVEKVTGPNSSSIGKTKNQTGEKQLQTKEIVTSIRLKCHQLTWKDQRITGFTAYPLDRGFDLGQKHVQVKFSITGCLSIRKRKKKKKYIAEELEAYQQLLVLGGIWHTGWYSSKARVCLLVGLPSISLQILERLRMWFLY